MSWVPHKVEGLATLMLRMDQLLHTSRCYAAGRRKVLWFNMREEPVIYINGNPYVVREANKPFANLEYTGESAPASTPQHKSVTVPVNRPDARQTAISLLVCLRSRC